MGLDRFFRRGARKEDPPAAAAGTPSEAEGPPPEGGAEADHPAADLAYSLGQMRPDEQRIAAVERLTELRAAGKVSEENFLKEKRRLLGKG